ncbi:BTB/POZ domain-containing protein 6-B isoform X1 [Pieris napi]|uniref:BTB/POZ domain-containing protein 6-B isoform X1 n=2 Tax=Pieris napi TaxID=78633 RepID=UPI001FB918BA|nr:BTB/POZ domain-containing protein 6-B isoform X1 [Pieris napi]
MQGSATVVSKKFPVVLGRILLRWVFTKADLVFFIYRIVWYAFYARSSMNSSVDFFESLIDEDGRFSELNCQEPTQRAPRRRPNVQRIRPQIQAENVNNGGGLSVSPPNTISQRELTTLVSNCYNVPTSPCGSKSSTPSPTALPTTPPGTATLDPNWQATKVTIRDRNAAMFNNQLMADVTFIVGPPGHIQVIPAHKYVLATGSSVFYAMFYGGLAECKQEIEVPDVEPSAFLTLLKYLYCDEIQLEADTVLSTLYVAKKYFVPHVARACVNYLETSLTAKNACLLLSQSRLFEEPELMQRCWEVIDAQAEMALTSDGFIDIDVSTLESVLARETLNCKEINLFEAALAWAQAECVRREIEPTPTNKRAMLGSAIYLVRFPTMTLEEFANSAAQLEILTPQETIDIFLHFTAATKPQLSYPIKARTGLKAQICHRFQSCAYRSNQWRYRGRCDSIQFCVDKRIFVVGFGLYGSSNGAADYNVKIELKRLGRVLAENNTKFFSDGSSSTFHVYFENPIQIEPECLYTASAVLDGSELSYFGQEGLTEVYMGTVTFQFHCSSESTNGTGVQGGQIPELIYYGPTVNAAIVNVNTNDD